MSGWIKLEKDRRDDPRVLRMARELRNAGVTHERFTSNFYVTMVLGCLDQLWCYADSHLRDGDTLDLGVDEIDELVGLKGFCNLMPTDWLEVLDTQRVKLPDFHGHNGTEAKKKAQSQKRQERKRNADALQEVTAASRKSVTPALPDQTKTRPDQDQERGARAARPAKRCPADFEVTTEMRRWAAVKVPNVDVDRETEAMRDWEFAKVRSDWPAVWRTWMRRAASNNGAGNGAHRRNGQQKPSAVESVERSTAEWAERRGVDPASI